MTGELMLFYSLAFLAVASATGMILARNMVYGVLLMAAHFIVTAVLYLTLQAPFLAAAQVIVYAGAIMVLFLFVVMLLGAEKVGFDEPLAGQRLVGGAALVVLGLILIGAVAAGVPAAGPPLPGMALDQSHPGGFGSPLAVGRALFERHLFAMEVVSVLLLVAMVGAVVVGQSRSQGE